MGTTDINSKVLPGRMSSLSSENLADGNQQPDNVEIVDIKPPPPPSVTNPEITTDDKPKLPKTEVPLIESGNKLPEKNEEANLKRGNKPSDSLDLVKEVSTLGDQVTSLRDEVAMLEAKVRCCNEGLKWWKQLERMDEGRGIQDALDRKISDRLKNDSAVGRKLADANDTAIKGFKETTTEMIVELEKKSTRIVKEGRLQAESIKKDINTLVGDAKVTLETEIQTIIKSYDSNEEGSLEKLVERVADRNMRAVKDKVNNLTSLVRMVWTQK